MRKVVILFLFCAVTAIGSPAQAFNTLHSFDYTDGATPIAGLVQGSDGNFYGTTMAGASNNCFLGCGTVFQITPSGTLTTLHSFCSETGCADGATPNAGLVQGSDGNFYGTTVFGGGDNSNCDLGSCGTVFRITPSGTLTTLRRFEGTEGNAPYAGVVQGGDGNFYGTTHYGGANQDGTVFKITASGILTTLYSFCFGFSCQDGDLPYAGLVQGSDGNFYGTTSSGGANDEGTVFKITTSGMLTTLYSFCAAGLPCADGASPYAGLVQATDGNFYGTTEVGGTGNHCFGGGGCGTAFKITPSGTLTTLYSFCRQTDCADGASPSAGLVQATDGSFYGTTSDGASNNCPIGCGTVFRLDTGFFAFLSLTKAGGGLVSSGDGHIYCGNVCGYPYPKDSQVTLSSVPAPGYTFTGWNGCDNVNDSYCYVTMTSAKDVTAAFTPANILLTSLIFNPSYVKGGKLSAGTLTLSAPAPLGGVTIALNSDHPGVAHPPSFVFITGGRITGGFAVNTFPVKSNTTVTITATAGSSRVSGTLTVGTTSVLPLLN